MCEAHFIVRVNNEKSTGCHFAKQTGSRSGNLFDLFAFLLGVFGLFFCCGFFGGRFGRVDGCGFFDHFKRFHPGTRNTRIEDGLGIDHNLHGQCFQSSERSVCRCDAADMCGNGFEHMRAKAVASVGAPCFECQLKGR